MYYTGTADNPAQLLNALKSHAEAQGWITDSSSADEWRTHNASGHWSFKALSDVIQFVGHTAFDGSKSWDMQPGSGNTHSAPKSYGFGVCRCWLGTSAFVAYHLYATADYLHLVTEIESGRFFHLLLGTVDKCGATYSGGQYVAGCSPLYGRPASEMVLEDYPKRCRYPFDSLHRESNAYPSMIRVDGQDGAPAPEWLRFERQDSNGIRCAIGLGRGYYPYSSFYHPSNLLVRVSLNPLTGGTLLIPCSLYSSGAQGRTRFLGEVKDFAVCRMDYLNAGDTVTVGTDDWRVFPATERTASDSTGSGMLGYAYKVSA